MQLVQQVSTQASRFRIALERLTGRLRAISLKEFPYGSCGDTSDLLGMFLSDSINVQTEYVSGKWKNRTHAWLECRGLIIDITADQFGGNESVLVTTDSAWHKLFLVEYRRESGLMGIGGAVGSHKRDLLDDYKLLAQFANSSVD